MNPILVDTSAYVAFKRGQPEAVTILRRAPAIAVNSVVLGELLGGFSVGARPESNRGELAQFIASPRVNVLSLDYRTAERYAAVYAALKTVGMPVPTNDMWIAASAMQHDLDLFSYDKHFRAVEGLRVGMSLSELETS